MLIVMIKINEIKIIKYLLFILFNLKLKHKLNKYICFLTLNYFFSFKGIIIL